MGIRGSYILMSPEALGRFQAREPDPEGQQHVQEEWFSIDKLWYPFHIALRRFGPPLSLAVNGDHQPSDCPPDIDSYADGRFPSDFYIATISPPLVKQVDEKLRNLSDADIELMIKESEVSPREYFTSNFAALREAYATAAQKSYALLVTIC